VQRDIVSEDQIAPPPSRDQLPPADRNATADEARPEPKRLLN